MLSTAVAPHYDTLIIGAGLSGIGAAVLLQSRCPRRSCAILEGRQTIGGTWDKVRYPGVRSDSDMYTLGYSFKPWKGARALAAGADILQYLQEVVDEYALRDKIQCGVRVVAASWSSHTAKWTVRGEKGPDGKPFTCTANFLYGCTGYFDYAKGHWPDLKGEASFEGQLVHAQDWRENIHYAERRVVVVGSGATAMTLVPTLAKRAAHVTLLQRSPSYVVPMPSENAWARRLRGKLPLWLIVWVLRWRNVLYGAYVVSRCRRRPAQMKRLLVGIVRRKLGKNYDVERHFTPRYDPWAQRLCIAADGDLFRAIRTGKVTVVTDEIDCVMPCEVALRSGRRVAADVMVLATGFRLQWLSNIEFTVDNVAIDTSASHIYKGMLLTGVPNFVFSFGYASASWTLKSEMTARYVCRLLNYMQRRGKNKVIAKAPSQEEKQRSFFDLGSGYIRRAGDAFPKQGTSNPWDLQGNHLLDRLRVQWAPIRNGALKFTDESVHTQGPSLVGSEAQ